MTGKIVSFQAKRPGTCLNCKEDYPAGALIYKLDDPPGLERPLPFTHCFRCHRLLEQRQPPAIQPELGDPFAPGVVELMNIQIGLLRDILKELEGQRRE